MNKFIFSYFSFIFYFMLFTSVIYAGKANCPPEAIHCIYNTTSSPPKWIKIVMRPRYISMILCLSNDDPVYLEKDDVENDGTLPGTTLTWELRQCVDEKCLSSRPMGLDQFRLLFENQRYDAYPRVYGFAFDPFYGESCAFSHSVRIHS